MISPEAPRKPLRPQAIEDFRRDGVVCVRQLYSPQWIASLTEALDAIFTDPAGKTLGVSETFRTGVFHWQTNDIVRDFVLEGPSAHIAQQAMGSKAINFFYDQVFIKAALTPDPTPWHHDATFWPLTGDQLCSLWTCVDPVDADSSALEFIAGSHLWHKRWKPIGVSGTVFSHENLEQLPDIEGDRGKYNIVSWALEPGDALLFHSRTVHGARGNRSADIGRRAITTRWCGDDVRYWPLGGQMPIAWHHGLQPGDRLGGPLFPQLLPEVDEAALAPRLAGLVPPDPALVDLARKQVASAERVAIRTPVA
jgi:ectoine hydroxylase-related dioxygenase (phytanoyl-CoA dioxygenase family)